MAIENPSTYEPKYGSLSDIPITGPDTYTDGQKRQALFNAEGTLELDLNGGDPISDNQVTRAHQIAVGYLGTHNLTYGSVAPEDTTLGDLADSGSRRDEYSSHFLEEYDRMIEKIIDSASGDIGGTRSNHSVAVNTRDPEATEEWYPQRRDARFPDN